MGFHNIFAAGSRFGASLAEMWQILTRADRLLILGVSFCILGLLFFQGENSQLGRELVVFSKGKRLGSFSLSRRQVLHFEGTLGETEVEIDGQAARVARAPCSRKLCMDMGWIRRPGEVAACLPNHFVIRVSGVLGESGMDAVSQ
jgi:hypothetical protein